jgi:hypothetical protein
VIALGGGLAFLGVTLVSRGGNSGHATVDAASGVITPAVTVTPIPPEVIATTPVDAGITDAPVDAALAADARPARKPPITGKRPPRVPAGTTTTTQPPPTLPPPTTNPPPATGSADDTRLIKRGSVDGTP